MAQSLVIVESPTKAKTISKYLGSAYQVIATVGHIKDLPKDSLGVDINNDFAPEYGVIPGKSKIIKEIRKAAKKADNVYLASDPDREGEAIAAHLSEELEGLYKGDIFRVLLFEITKKAIKEKITNAEKLDIKKYDAQKARRILDRLVGYQISPLLWEKVRYGLSAGRVQSVAVRLICEREKIIKAFIVEEYWSIHANVKNKDKKSFELKLAKINGKNAVIGNETEAQKIVDACKKAPFNIDSVTKKDRRRNPVPPFITSTLQQEASRKLGFSSKQTMRLAQQLYEGVDEKYGGLITYMRTDSIRISDTALGQVRDEIVGSFGAEYCPKSPNVYKTKAGKVQDAHEAIRPTNPSNSPKKIRKLLNDQQLKLYTLIWNRFTASQMAKALFHQTQVQVTTGYYTWRASGSVMVFAGFLKVYEEGIDSKSNDKEDQSLPQLQADEELDLIKLNPVQHFTEPPARYSNATLIKELEDKGIGRPSTFASIMDTIEKRTYVEKIKNRFIPTPTGQVVNELLVKNFSEILDISFTAKLETTLDDIEAGNRDWQKSIGEFYEGFEKELLLANKNMEDLKRRELPTDIECLKCGDPMVIKWGKNGEFLACSNYPECKSTGEIELDEDGKPQLQLPKVSEIKCDKCGNDFIEKNGKFGKFLACSNYPECKNTRPIEGHEPEKVEGECEQCGSELIKKVGRYGPFIACSNYPDCKYLKKDNSPKETGVTCPKCTEGELLERRSRRGKVFFSCATYPKCDYSMWDKPIYKDCSNCDSKILGEKVTKKGMVLKCPSCSNSITL